MNVRLLQISDSALPIGGYTHSWGLEAAIARGTVHDAATLERWTDFWLRNSVGPMEGVLAATSCRRTRAGDLDGVRALNSISETTIVPLSIRAASREMGEQLLELSATWSWCADGVAPILNVPESRCWHHAVVFGMLGALAGAEAAEVLNAYLHTVALGMISAGVRAIPVGHTHGQQVLSYIHDSFPALAADLLEREPESAGAGCPFYEVLCDEQSRLYARMFRS